MTAARKRIPGGATMPKADFPFAGGPVSPKGAVRIGAVAQLGERRNGIAKVRGSIPLGSTILKPAAMRAFSFVAKAFYVFNRCPLKTTVRRGRITGLAGHPHFGVASEHPGTDHLREVADRYRRAR